MEAEKREALKAPGNNWPEGADDDTADENVNTAFQFGATRDDARATGRRRPALRRACEPPFCPPCETHPENWPSNVVVLSVLLR